MICVVWDNNTVDKAFHTQNVINAKLDEVSLKLLKNIYGTSKMETTDNEVSRDNASNDKVEISLELLKNIRNLIEVTNSRIQWKTEELLPVGIMIKQMDEFLKSKSS